MQRIWKVSLLTAALALGLVPAMAVGGVKYEGPDYHPSHPPHPTHPHGKEPKGKAFGFHCRGESKKHVKGQKGTPFSQCVKAMARAAKNDKMKAKKACKGLSKKHVKGTKGTPFSICVKGVAQMRREQAAAVRASSVA
jgi:hypothetical protein